MVTFDYPLFLGMLPLVPLVLWWRWYRPRPALRFSGVRLVAELRPGRGLLIRRLDASMFGLAAFGLVMALASPRLPLPTPIITEGIALILVVDVSGSMYEVDSEWDGQPVTRLESASQCLNLFVRGGISPRGQVFGGRPRDLIGLVTFASYPELVAPLTQSHHVLLQLLALERTRPADESQTNIGDAIAEALLGLEAAAHRRRVIIILSDGEHNFTGREGSPTWTPRLAARRAADLGVPIYAIDAGSDLPDNVDRVSGQNELRNLAELSGGRYFQTNDSDSLLQAYQDIDRMERRPIESDRFQRYRRLHRIFGISAFVFLVAGWLLQSTLGRRLP